MQSKISYSEMSLFRRCLGRHWLLWLMMAAVLLFWLPIPIASTLAHAARGGSLAARMREFTVDEVLGRIRYQPNYAMLFGLGTAMAVFEHVCSAKLMGLFSSLPVRREKLFFQHWLAGAVMLLSAGLLAALATLAVEAVYGAAGPSVVFSWFGVYTLEALAFYGIAVFCVMLTGHVLVIPALFLLVNFAAVAMEVILQGLLSCYAYGVTSAGEGSWLATLSPAVRLLSVRYDSVEQLAGFSGWGWAIVYCVVGLILTALALMLFKRRHMERALDTTAFPVLRPILKTIVTIFFALGFPFLVLFFLGGFRLYGGAEGARFFPAHLALTLLGAVIGYFLSEMIIHKSLRGFRGKSWLGALLLGVLCCGVVSLFRFDAFGIETRVPDADEVAAVELHAAGRSYRISDEAGIGAAETLHRAILARREENLRAAGDSYGDGVFLKVNYLLENGERVLRQYLVCDDVLLRQVEDTLNSPAVMHWLKELTPPVPMDRAHVSGGEITYTDDGKGYDEYLTLTGAEALAFYEEAVLPDVQAGNYGKQTLNQSGDDYIRTRYAVNVTIWLTNEEELYYQPTADTEHTNAWLEAHDIPLKTLAELGR